MWYGGVWESEALGLSVSAVMTQINDLGHDEIIVII